MGHQLRQGNAMRNSCGTYQPELARQYVTNMVNLAANANGQNNQTIQLFNQARSQAPVHFPCFFWDQVAPPGNWPAGQRWQPVRILVSNNVMHFLPEKNSTSQTLARTHGFYEGLFFAMFLEFLQ